MGDALIIISSSQEFKSPACRVRASTTCYRIWWPKKVPRMNPMQMNKLRPFIEARKRTLAFGRTAATSPEDMVEGDGTSSEKDQGKREGRGG